MRSSWGIGAALLAWWWLGINLASLPIVGAALGGYLWFLNEAAPRDGISEET
jgi:hypothetical protein